MSSISATNPRDSRWLVTGAAGFIGYHICARLLEAGAEVVGIDALNSYYDPALKQARLAQLRRYRSFAFHQVDCADDRAVALLFSQVGPGTVVHMAAQAGVRYSAEHPMAYVHSNLIGFSGILEACRRNHVEHLVYASSSSVYGDLSRTPFRESTPVDHPVSLYAATKRANELMAHSYSHMYGLPTSGLRFFTVYGPWGRPDMAYYAFAEAMLRGAPITMFGDGSAIRDFTYIDDIVDGVLGVAGRPPTPATQWALEDLDPSHSPAPFRILNIGHGGQVSVRALIEMLADRLGVEPMINQQPNAIGDVGRTHADTTALEGLTGVVPSVPLSEGLTRFTNWLKAYTETPYRR